MMLVVFGGLPGTGKTTISRGIALRCPATYLRIDVIEQAIRSSGVLPGEVGPSGYIVANALAASNLANGKTVIADCVNPVPESRRGWQITASRARTALLEVEVMCSDLTEHRRRVEARVSDIDGLILPTWDAIMHSDYAAWTEPRVVIDTARLTVEEAIATVEQHMVVRSASRV
jgi:predicted kinase